MLMPRLFGEDLFDTFFNDFPFYDDRDMKKLEKKLYGRKAARMMKTDIKEKKDSYEIIMDLPGFKKEEVQVSLEDGCLTVSAVKGQEAESGGEEGRYIRQERYEGACSRSFYVGDAVQKEDIKAEFRHGILKLFIPKREARPAVEQNQYISIEG